MKRVWIPQAVVTPLLLWALVPSNPYAYYILLRWICCAAFTYLAIQAFDQRKQGWTWVLAITAAVYNPLIPLHLNREIWCVANVATVIAGISLFVLRVRDEQPIDPTLA